jgi:hypothetical protein
MFTKCKQTQKFKEKDRFNSLGVDLSFDTHTDDLLPVFKVFSKCRQTIVYVHQM